MIYAIGDMHGRCDLFHEALRVIEEHSLGEPCTLVVMGDFVDRGPRSAQLIQALRQGQHNNIDFVVLQGNHEDMMIACCLQLARMSWWIGNGGDATLRSYGYAHGDLLEPFKGNLGDDIRWLASLPKFYDTDDRVFVHAGVAAGVSLAMQSKDMLQWHCWDRNWEWEHEHAEEHTDANYFKHVVHGHEQWAKGPILLTGRTNLDSFAWKTGRLAIGVFEDGTPQPVEILWAEGDPM